MEPLLSRFPGLGGFPQVDLGVRPTPVEPLRILGLDHLVKRDDRCGGNKPRSLEFLLARHTGRALCKIGEPAVAPLAKALSSGSLEARADAVEVLGRLAKDSAAARAVLPGLLDEALAGTPRSGSAAYHLSTMGPKAAFALKELRAAHAAAKDETVKAYLAKAIEAVETR